MRTTARIDDRLMRDVKRYALEQRKTVTAVFEEALRELLGRREEAAARREPVEFPTFAGRGARRGVDLHDSAALADLMDARGDDRS
jgi:hypothetical protein